MTNISQVRCFAAAWAAVLMLIGCGPGGNYVTVTGRVTLDGEPLENTSVMFNPSPGTPATQAYGRTDADGLYSLSASDAQEGVLPGEYRVVIRTSDAIPDPSGGRPEMSPELVPERYNKNTELKVDVVPDQKSQTFDFNLEDTSKKAPSYRERRRLRKAQ